MIDDPYKVLGLQQGATTEEIKKAYRKMAKIHHPDLHPNDPKAHKKMNEINEAYDMLTNPNKYASQRTKQEQYQQYNTSSQNQQQTYSGWNTDFETIFGYGFAGQQQTNAHPSFQPGDSKEIQQVIAFINNGRSQDAIRILTLISGTNRNARWYYLSAYANQALGNRIQAIDHIQKAVQMDPQNPVYKKLLLQYRRSEQTYSHNAEGFDLDPMNFGRMFCGFFFLQMFCCPTPCIRFY